MKVFKRFKHLNGVEYELCIEKTDTTNACNIHWNCSLRRREPGRRKWVTIDGRDQNFGKAGNERILEQKRERWVLRQVPEEWWWDTLVELHRKISENFEFYLYKNYKTKKL